MRDLNDKQAGGVRGAVEAGNPRLCSVAKSSPLFLLIAHGLFFLRYRIEQRAVHFDIKWRIPSASASRPVSSTMQLRRCNQPLRVEDAMM